MSKRQVSNKGRPLRPLLPGTKLPLHSETRPGSVPRRGSQVSAACSACRKQKAKVFRYALAILGAGIVKTYPLDSAAAKDQAAAAASNGA